MRRVLVVGVIVALSAIWLAAPAGAQQLVDAGEEGNGSGGLAFVLFAAMVFLTWGAIFLMDRIRRRPSERGQAPTN